MSEIFAAVLGALVVWITTYFSEQRKSSAVRKKDASHLGVLVLVRLERFISECYAASRDNGTALGQAAGRHASGEDYFYPQTEVPHFQIDDLGVEWRSISSTLMYSVHSIQLLLRDAETYLAHVQEMGDFEGTDYMAARQERYTEIGVKAADIAGALRMETKIPAKPYGKWSAESQLREQHAVYEAQNEAQREAHADFLAQSNP
ncbi:hypothetical protein JAK48_13330 [Stenotrophomonas maltophilia]|uniref:hypothetical protein n=1 Tax=Stenotrophomonas pavanii TaxID=487698 RepID=UPI00087F98EB|nr:hypothetical protein [Stenotrophomonas pavanii]MCU1047524.1 hypothetical protein [Stenotrophomonas maltophilia]NGM54071.1 hypothetical protein [Stenotrophomonas pavanii]QGL96098.1 hypothetical protein FEO90_04595 [Stenotrophomonas maltophilia]SDK81290.1 hypothetical protein SAMN04487784_3448 [Stenotrophomonas pavanii]